MKQSESSPWQEKELSTRFCGKRPTFSLCLKLSISGSVSQTKDGKSQLCIICAFQISVSMPDRFSTWISFGNILIKYDATSVTTDRFIFGRKGRGEGLFGDSSTFVNFSLIWRRTSPLPGCKILSYMYTRHLWPLSNDCS